MRGMQTLGRRLAAAFVLVLVLTAAVGGANAKEISFCFNDWPPYSKLENDKPAGISVEILREAARRAGYSATFRELPWKRCLDLVKKGEIDAVIDAADRDEFLQGPVSVSLYTNTFWVHDKSGLKKLDFEALRGKTIGLVNGYKYPKQLSDDIARAEMKIDYAVDDATNLRKLGFGRVDVIVADHVSTLLEVKTKGLTLTPLSPAHSADRLYASFNPARQAAQKTINDALAAMLADGFVDRVYRRHLGIGFKDVNTTK